MDIEDGVVVDKYRVYSLDALVSVLSTNWYGKTVNSVEVTSSNFTPNNDSVADYKENIIKRSCLPITSLSN